MAKTRIRTGRRKDIFLYSTDVENLFINEFLPDAPGDCVKVFLFGLMYAQFDEDIDSVTMGRTLGMSENDVDNAWKYWESKGLVNITGSKGSDDYGIEFVRQIDMFYGKTPEEAYQEQQAHGDDSAEDIISRLIDQQLREITDKYQTLSGRTISRHEAAKFNDAVRIYNIEPDVLAFAIDYCTGIDKYSIEYICKVALRWTEEGCRDVAQVKTLLDRHSKRNDSYRKIFTALGFNRPSTPADREIMDRWLDDMGFTIGEIIEACNAAGGIREPNFRYVNKVLENKILEKGGINTRRENVRRDNNSSGPAGGSSGGSAAGAAESQDAQPKARVSRKVLRDYYDHIRKEEEKSYYARIDEVNLKIPEMRDIFRAETDLNTALISTAPGPDSRERRALLRDRRQRLEENKKELLLSGGYPEDYLERKYRCDLCKDTGYTDEGRVCVCCRERAEEAYNWIQDKGNR